MKKKLHLGFVMGGGVSLGTFSGSALTEAIKQQIVYGQYDTGQRNEDGTAIMQPYDDIVIDVFSGASAGAISLAVMLRILSNYKDNYNFLGFADYPSMEKHMIGKLRQQFREQTIDHLQETYPIKWKKLIVAQIVQSFQDEIWSKKVDIQRFLGVEQYQKDLNDLSSFMDRSIIDDIGRTLFQFNDPTQPLEVSELLSERVIFACTLANLSHTLKRPSNATIEKLNKPSLIKALNDCSVDRVHSEIRVFDIHFNALKENQNMYYPLKWIQVHNGPSFQVEHHDNSGNVYQKKVYSINEEDAWKEIAATSIASGAFPIAFDPVVLKRYRHEYADQWPEELNDKLSYPFTYIDGGIFNNEPIQEAIKIGAYLDTISGSNDIERQIIFVDPNVTELENQFRMSTHDSLNISRSLLSDKLRASQKPTIFRILSTVTHVLSALLNEAQRVELSNLEVNFSKFRKRDLMRSFYKQSIQVPDDNHISQWRQFVFDELDTIRHQRTLPKNVLQVQHEFLRIIFEEEAYFKNELNLDSKDELIDQINEFLYVDEPSKTENARIFCYLLACLALDISMDLITQTQMTQLIPIAPFNFYKEEPLLDLLSLPGGALAGFAGFASKEASLYEIEYGKYCAKNILEMIGVCSRSEQHLPLPEPFNADWMDTKVRNSLLEAIMKRLKEMTPKTVATLIPLMDSYLRDNLSQFIDKQLDENNETEWFEFRIKVPNDVLVLRGFHKDGKRNPKRNIFPVPIEGEYFIMAKVAYDHSLKAWVGNHTNFMQNIYIDKEKLFEDIPLLSIELPAIYEQSDAILSPNPIFEIDARNILALGVYTELSASHWQLRSEIKPLNESIW